MLHILDGNSEHVAQGLFVENKILFVTDLDLIKCLKQIK